MARFRVFSITTETRGRVKSTVFTAESEGEAKQLAKRASAALGRDTTIGIEEIKSGEKATISKVVGPVPSERGRQLQKTRERAEKIEEKVTVTGEGKPDISALSIDERRFIKRITGQKAEKAFTVKTTPATGKEFEQSLSSRQRQLKTLQKQAVLKSKETPLPVTGPAAKEISFTPGGLIRSSKFSLIQKAKFRVEKLFTTSEQKVAQLGREGKTARAIGLGTLVFGLSAAKGVVLGVTAPFRPSFYKQTFRLITKPKESLGGLGRELMLRPASTLGELVGFQKGLGLITKKITAPLAKTRVEGAAISKFKPSKGKIPRKGSRPIDVLGRTPEEIRIEKAQAKSDPFGPTVKIEEPKPKPKFQVEPKVEVTISDKGEVTTRRMVTGEAGAAAFTKISQEGVLGKTAFPGLGKAVTEPKGAAAKLGELLGPKRQQQLILLESELAGPAEGVAKQTPQRTIIFPSLARLRSVVAARTLAKPLSITSLVSLQQLKPVQLTKQDVLTTQKAVTLQKQALTAGLVQRGKSLLRLKIGLVPLTLSATTQATRQATESELILKSKLKGLPSPKLFPLLNLGFQKKKGKKGSKKSEDLFNPFAPQKVGSILAGVLGIKESAKTPFPKTITGLEIRPVPVGRRK